MTMQQSISAAFAAVGGDIKALRASSEITSGVIPDGCWVRWPDGTQMCWEKIMRTAATAIPPGGDGVFGSGSNPLWVFPRPFLFGPAAFVTVSPLGRHVTGYAGNSWDVVQQEGALRQINIKTFHARNHTSYPIRSMQLLMTAAGRWK